MSQDNDVKGLTIVKAVLGPMPRSSIMPTGGVAPTRDSIQAWFKAGVTCVGIGSKFIDKELVAKKDWAALTARVHECLKLIKEARSE